MLSCFRKQTQILKVRKANYLDFKDVVHANERGGFGAAEESRRMQCQDFIPNTFKERFSSGNGAAGIVNGTLKGIPHQFPTPNAA